MKLELPVEILDETLASIIEGADFGYWGEYTKYVDASDILAGKGMAIICERDDDTGEPLEGSAATLSLADIRCGLHIMARRYPRHFADILAGEGDCETGDVLVQLAVLGEIKYG